MVRGTINNVDATLILETPKLAAHREAIEASLTGVIGSRVNVKATTNEGMGWIGRGEGIACIAVSSVKLS